jgi:hypothetical protein
MAKGPNFIADLVKVLIQFRRHPVALTMDVKEMFLQVQMTPRSRRYHRFVFQWPGQQGVHRVSVYSSPVWEHRFAMYRDVYCQTTRLGVPGSVSPRPRTSSLNYSIIDDAMTSAPSVAAAEKVYAGVKTILRLVPWRYTKSPPTQTTSSDSSRLWSEQRDSTRIPSSRTRAQLPTP